MNAFCQPWRAHSMLTHGMPEQGVELFREAPTLCTKLNKDNYAQNPYVVATRVDRRACSPGVVRVTLVSEPRALGVLPS